MITILLLVLGADPSPDTPSSAVAAAMADGLGGHGRVELERVTSMPSDAEADQRAKKMEASGVAEVTWSDAKHAHVHVHVPPSTNWIDRDLAFDASSPGWERGRAVGLAIAAMFPDEASSPETTENDATTSSAETASAKSPEKPKITADSASSTTTTMDETSASTRKTSMRRPPFELGLFGELAPSYDDETAGVGGRMDATWWLTRTIGIRAVAGARWATLAGLDTRVGHVDAGLGLAVRLGDDPFTITLRGELRLAHEEVVRDRFDGAEERHGHTLPVTALLVEGSYRLSPHFAFAAALGTEIALGTTDIQINRAEAAELPTFTLIGALGVRWGL